VLSGIYQARAAAQFGVFHPQSGPDAFPNKLGFTPEKLQVQSSYKPPTRLFENGRVIDIVVAGEPVQVAPNRSDTTDSVGFYFPRYNGTIGWYGGYVPQGRRRSCKERWAGELALEPQAHVAVAAARQLGQLTSSARADSKSVTSILASAVSMS
jgi:hypothetical protein